MTLNMNTMAVRKSKAVTRPADDELDGSNRPSPTLLASRVWESDLCAASAGDGLRHVSES